MTKHKKEAYKLVAPRQEILPDGRLALSFRDILKNLVAQELNGNRHVDTYSFIDKVKNSSESSTKHGRAWSPKHRRRILRQQKRIENQARITSKLNG